mmetsp:Transcript_45039/g.73401  ORF Transcript_45039/g.73401 Transcript_45039/m.73401 type:complete len:96 (+) Transcript_45039:84-371(+)
MASEMLMICLLSKNDGVFVSSKLSWKAAVLEHTLDRIRDQWVSKPVVGLPSAYSFVKNKFPVELMDEEEFKLGAVVVPNIDGEGSSGVFVTAWSG